MESLPYEECMKKQTIGYDKGRFPPIEPFNSGMLQVSDLHNLYFEECGNKDGKPVLFVHGGPGGGVNANQRRHFDPSVWRAVLFDQRGSGKSTPSAELRENTTWDLVEDMERLRKHLGIDKWVLFGGSWGSTLSLAYAETHPDRVKALVLRGIFTLRREELTFYYQNGSSFLFPEEFEKYQSVIPEVERHDMMSAYYRRLTGDNEEEKLKCATAWTRWEMATSCLYTNPKKMANIEDPEFSLKFARIECHYFVNGGFFHEDGQLIKNAKILREHNIPGSIVQGRFDCVCPTKTAYDLHKNWPEANYIVVADSGHSATEPGTFHHLVEELEKYKDL